MIYKTICIMCPVGCELEITKDNNNNVTVTGNACIKGDEYGKQEILQPKRVVTTLVKTQKGVLPCKTLGQIPKEKVFDCLNEIAKLNLKSAKFGQVIITNILNTGVDVVITGNYQTNKP